MVLDDINSAIRSLTDTFGKLFSQMESLVKVANPAVYNQLQFAFQDLSAVVGRVFVPVIRAAIPIVRALADAVATSVPVLGSIFTNIANVVKDLSPALKEAQIGFIQISQAIARVANIFINGAKTIFKADDIVSAVDVITSAITKLVLSFEAIAEAINDIIQTGNLRSLVGIFERINERAALLKDIARDTQIRSSVGAAPRQATLSSFEDIGRNAAKAAFSQSSVDPAVESLQVQKDIAKYNALIAEQTAKMAGKAFTVDEFLQQLKQAVLQGLLTPPAVHVGRALKAAGGFLGL